MRQSVLLTGGTGFFGRCIAVALREQGDEVHTPGRPAFDLFDRESVRRTLWKSSPEIVVHSAAYYGGLGICLSEPANIFIKNVLMTCHILDALPEADVKRFVPVGSACAYPGKMAGDMREDDYWSGAL